MYTFYLFVLLAFFYIIVYHSFNTDGRGNARFYGLVR
jgi:cbb3-type cytochrome oxidase subunit 3